MTVWIKFWTLSMLDRADRAAQLGEAAEATDRGVARIGALGRREIVQHAVAVVGPEYDLPVGRTPRVLLQQRLQHRDHVDVTVEMIGLVEGQAIRLALGRAQMRKGDARTEAFGHRGKIVLGAHAERPRAQAHAIRL